MTTCCLSVVRREMSAANMYAMPIRCNTPGMRTCVNRSSGKNGKTAINRPNPTISTPRRTICLASAPSSAPSARRALSDRCVVTPAMNRKNGKITSVGVHPFHSACSSGG